MSHMPHHHRKSRRAITVSIQPTLGKPFAISCSPQLTVENLKEDISDRLGISPKKMSVLFQSKELTDGSLLDNLVEDGADLRLVPTLEAGVSTSVTMDPMTMMKHSMSNISDQQIDEFLAGKSPLSVAIRLGESVVVVNLNRAKVEEVEVEPPPIKQVCSRSHSRRSTGDIPASHPSPSATTTMLPTAAGVSTTSLNSNPHWSAPSPQLSSVAAPCSTATPTIGSRHPTQTLSATPAPTPPISSPAPSISSPTASALPSPDQPCSSGQVTKRDSSKSSRSKSSSKVQLSQAQWEELRRLQEAPSSDSGISMKRKAVMEAIGEILKKMYTQRAKGKIPGSFKGRFSSEFTCDGDMKEIIHSRTTMTSYGDVDSYSNGMCSSSRAGIKAPSTDVARLTQSKLEENEVLRGKVAMLKWRMQHCRAQRKAKRKRSDKPSPCGWMEAIDCDIAAPPPKIRKKTGVCGFKRGFLLAD